MSDRQLATLAVDLMRFTKTDAGVKQFLREQYGVSADKSRYLFLAALDMMDGSQVVFDDEAVEDGDTLTATFTGPVRTTKELAELLGIDESKYDLVGGTAKAWGKANNQSISVAAEFKPRVYPSLAESDREALREDLAQYAPVYEPIDPPREFHPEDVLLEIFITDLHVGFGTDVSLTRLSEAVSTGIEAARKHQVQRAVLVLNGDSLNVDNGRYTTTAGTPQEDDTTWQESFRALRGQLVKSIDQLSAYVSHVDVYILPGNHDQERAFYLADVLWAWYNKNRRVKIDIGLSPRKYIKWGVNLIGLAHGHNEKPADLAMLIMRDNQADLADVRNFEWHLGHVHHQVSLEIQGVLLKWFRALTENNAWASRKGFGDNPRSATSMLWHARKGLIAEFHYIAETK